MLPFILRKLFYGVLVLISVVVLVFFLFQGFGDPARLVMGQSGDSATINSIRKELALDQPKWKQFLLYLNDVSPISMYTQDELDTRGIKGFAIGATTKVVIKMPYLRKSYQSKKDVTDILAEALPGTLILAFAAMFFATVVGVVLGALAAVKQNTWVDTSAVFASVLGISVPSFFMGIMLAYVFGFLLSDFTGLHMTGSLY